MVKFGSTSTVIVPYYMCVIYFPFVNSYLLPDEKNLKSCKTKRVQKSSSPIWDEYFVIDGVAQSQLRKQQLGIRVVNWHLGINKKNSLLGELRIGCRNVFDFHSLASPIIMSPRDFSMERSMNDRAVYSPLVRGNTAQGRNGATATASSSRAEETREQLHSPTHQNNHASQRHSETADHSDSDDDPWLDTETAGPLVQNLKRLNATSDCGEANEDSKDISIRVSQQELEENNNSHVIVNGTNSSEEKPKGMKVKPPRPPPPTRLHLLDGQQSPNGCLSPKPHHGEKSSLNTPDSGTRVFTPTFSRLMLKLPMSPKRGRRLSWGGESEVSIDSPRSIKSPDDDQSSQSSQWDIMISRPKQWIYCWQTLLVSVSEWSLKMSSVQQF